MANKLADISPAVVRELEEARGISATRGHCAGQMGLRGHSVGGVFPCVVFQHGNPDAGIKWGFHTPTNEQYCNFDSYDDAYLAAGIWLDNRPVSFMPEVDV